MIGIVRRHMRGRADGEEGIALVVAIALIAVVGMLIASIVAVAMYESGASGRDRQRSQAVMAAEQSIDMLMAQIQGASAATLPCGTLLPQPISVVSDRLTVMPTVRYFDQDENELTDCAAIQAGSVRAYSAQISATATSEALAGQAPAVRSMEMLVSMEPEFANDMTKAIFGDGGVVLANHAEIFGENGLPNADVYTNKSLICNNNQQYHGSIYAQENVILSNSCWVAVDVYAGLRFEGNNSGVTVNGRVMVANGNASMVNNMHVGQQVLVSGTIESGATTGVCATPNKCFQGATVAPVPHQDFPIMNADLTEWLAAPPHGGGYTDVVRFGPGNLSCTGSIPNPYNGKADWVGYWIFLHGPTLSADTIIVSDCENQKVMFQGLDPSLNKNLVIFSKAGFVFSNSTTISSTDGGQRNLYLIQPYDAVTVHPCTTQDGISLDNQVTVTPEVSMLLYSPCNIRKANNSTHYGQIYAGGLATIDNNLTMYYEPLPVFGVQASSTIESYSLEIQFKRENV